MLRRSFSVVHKKRWLGGTSAGLVLTTEASILKEKPCKLPA